jgi:CMP-N,N'-diacetyllegionaminic acid synthase
MRSTDVLALIPARGGSKGVPGKNLRMLGGRPLIGWTISDALEAEIGPVVVSTDDDRIAEVALELGAEVPFRRPSELADDRAPTLPVVVHALDELLSAGREFVAVCLLQPTTPFRGAGLVADSVDLWRRTGADSVVTVRETAAELHPDWAYDLDADGSLRLHNGEAEPTRRRQDLTPVFHRDGAVYVTGADIIRSGSLYGLDVRGLVTTGPTVNIDTLEDVATAERLLAERGG